MRGFFAGIGVLAVSCCLIAGCGIDRAPKGGARPNIVLIVTDTARADYFSSYGFPRATTPAFDAIAAEGTRYAQTISTSFWTLPAHASILTGLYPTEAQATSETNHLAGELNTIAERLLEAGYRTYGTSSNPWISIERGFSQGFESYQEAWKSAPTASQPTEEHVAVEQATRWIDEAAANDAPFFVFVNINTPHLPYKPPEPWLSRFVDEPRVTEQIERLMTVRGAWGHFAGMRRVEGDDVRVLRGLYAGEIRQADEHIARLIEALRSRELIDDTLLILTSDHGENLGEHGKIDHVLSLYDTTVHVPLVLRLPERVEANHVEESLISLADLFPTMLDAAGADRDGEAAGRSLLASERVPRRFVAAENDRPVHGVRIVRENFPWIDTEVFDRRMRMVRTSRHKLIWHVGRSMELYDLAEDPDELHDLAEAQPALREEMFDLLREWRAGLGTLPEAEAFESNDSETLDRLRSLGYVE